jgi:hypothetical protein
MTQPVVHWLGGDFRNKPRSIRIWALPPWTALGQNIHEADRYTAMWRRLDQLRAQMTSHRKAQRQLAVDITAREKVLRARGAQLTDISDAFKEEVERIGIPTDGIPRIDPSSFLPLVGDTEFEALQASGGGASTALNIAYHLTLLTAALDTLASYCRTS